MKQLELAWRSSQSKSKNRSTRASSALVAVTRADICRRGVPHSRRPDVRGPLHVVQRIARGLPDLRSPRNLRLFERCFRGVLARTDFRVTQYSVQRDHIHLVVEADDRHALARGMQALAIRIAKQLNARWNRRGKGAVFAERYFARVLNGYKELWRAVRYVLLNGRKHGTWTKSRRPDPFSSAPWHLWGTCDIRRPTRRQPVKSTGTAYWLATMDIDHVPGTAPDFGA